MRPTYNTLSARSEKSTKPPSHLTNQRMPLPEGHADVQYCLWIVEAVFKIREMAGQWRITKRSFSKQILRKTKGGRQMLSGPPLKGSIISGVSYQHKNVIYAGNHHGLYSLTTDLAHMYLKYKRNSLPWTNASERKPRCTWYPGKWIPLCQVFGMYPSHLSPRVCLN